MNGQRDPIWVKWLAVGLFGLLLFVGLGVPGAEAVVTRNFDGRTVYGGRGPFGHFEGASAVFVGLGLILAWVAIVAAMIWFVRWQEDLD